MKKLLSILLVLAVILSIGVTASAATSDGIIKITNATLGQEYTIYKIFDAVPTADGTGFGYKIDPEKDAALFKALFGEDGKTENPYFSYISASDSVNKNTTANDSELINYLTKIILGDETTPKTPVSVFFSKTADSSQVVFDELPYGYYLITSSLGAVVTLDSTAPLAEVIDKNQKPGVIEKQVVNATLEEVLKDIENKTNKYNFADSTSANIGDLVTYKISFVATSYDGDQIIKYYQINDIKGDAIWAEFNTITVKVNGETLKRGYYLPVGDAKNTEGWQWLGDWTGVEKNRNNADWYLVHLGFDEFRITIPWLEDYELEGDETANEETGKKPGPYTLEFNGETETPKYDPRVTVEIFYEAAVEPTATIGKLDVNNLSNTARLSWVTAHDIFSGGEDTAYTYTYGIGLIKEDSSTRENLPGAVFELFDANNNPVFVIPTDCEGVYMIDSLGCPSEHISGSYMEDAREIFGKEGNGGLQRLLAYLDGDLTNQKNEVVSPVNGRIIILGLEKGDYYLVETDPPAGYRGLSQPQKITVDDNHSAFTIFANEEGKVADIQQSIGDYTEVEYHLSSIIVQNSRGMELPSTGGAGTFWLITIGSLMAIGFAVFLITNKKMSVYVD